MPFYAPDYVMITRTEVEPADDKPKRPGLFDRLLNWGSPKKHRPKRRRKR